MNYGNIIRNLRKQNAYSQIETFLSLSSIVTAVATYFTLPHYIEYQEYYGLILYKSLKEKKKIYVSKYLSKHIK